LKLSHFNLPWTIKLNKAATSVGAESRILRVLVADDSETMRRVIRKLLQEHSDIAIVSEAPNGAEAIDEAREHTPDVVILDIAMPVLNGISAARLIKTSLPAVKILMLSQFDARAFMKESFAAGANGYVANTDTGSELLPGIEAILGRKKFVSSGIRLARP
jgi:DNA-binding NarL/FixJ family response regulator